MTNITFPAFNINLSISRTAFTIGGIHIYWYAIFIAVAILIAILALKKDCKKYNPCFCSFIRHHQRQIINIRAP